MKGFREATMMYRKGTQVKIHEVFVDTKVIEADDIEAHLADGWFLSPADLKASLKSVVEEPKADLLSDSAVDAKPTKGQKS